MSCEQGQDYDSDTSGAKSVHSREVQASAVLPLEAKAHGESVMDDLKSHVERLDPWLSVEPYSHPCKINNSSPSQPENSGNETGGTTSSKSEANSPPTSCPESVSKQPGVLVTAPDLSSNAEVIHLREEPASERAHREDDTGDIPKVCVLPCPEKMSAGEVSFVSFPAIGRLG